MLKTADGVRHQLIHCLMPGVKVYLRAAGDRVEPFDTPGLFRGNECFDGSLKGWRRWGKPSPEPKSDPKLKEIVIQSLKAQAGSLCALHDRLLMKLLEKIPDKAPIVFVSILRAGVFVAQGLSKRMSHHGYGEAPVVAIGLFNEAGFDFSALSAVIRDYPGYYPVFVDGWTGRGVVARELKRTYGRWKKSSSVSGLPETPLLATLVDPGRHGDLYGTDRDTPVPCAHFTAPQVFGFSRAFIKDPREMWSAYRYPEEYYDSDLVNAWFNVFEAAELPPVVECSTRQVLSELLEETAGLTMTRPDQWKVNINEVVRTFVNRSPKEILLGVSEEVAGRLLPDVLYLAGRTGVPVQYLPEWGRRHNCLAAVRVK